MRISIENLVRNSGHSNSPKSGKASEVVRHFRGAPGPFPSSSGMGDDALDPVSRGCPSSLMTRVRASFRARSSDAAAAPHADRSAAVDHHCGRSPR